ncbi:MAG: cytidine deaminase [Acholeplasmatales bacterium]|jgi:cytidine deaminase|nr:cytidine deaminase [Acholeplasmatales bacterium]
MDNNIKDLIKETIDVSKRAYTPYSKFNVGALLVLQDGTKIFGVNVENASFGLSNCAERSAIFSLISLGYNPKDIKTMVIVGNTNEPISPCGACRQVLAELLPIDTKIYLSNYKFDIKETSVSYLLPYSFDFFKDKK